MNNINGKLVPNYLPFVPKESIELVTKTLKSGWIGGDGPRVKEFETKIGKVIKNPNVAAVNSATSGLELALKMAGVSGGEVISTPMTCFATNAAIVNQGATPVWVDVDPESGNIDFAKIEAKITKKTRAIMVVDWGGTPPELDGINKIARKHKLPIIEDSAQSLGSFYKRKMIGNHADYVVFSTQAIKIITTGDGGMVALGSKEGLSRAKRLRWYGIDREKRKYGPLFWSYPITEVGGKLQMNDILASVGLGQLPKLKSLLAHHRRIAVIYNKALSAQTKLKPQKIPAGATPNYWIYTVLCGSVKNRNKLQKELLKIGVKSEQAHRRNDLYPVFKKYQNGALPGVAKFDKEHLIIPIGYWVNLETAKKIAKVLSEFK